MSRSAKLLARRMAAYAQRPEVGPILLERAGRYYGLGTPRTRRHFAKQLRRMRRCGHLTTISYRTLNEMFK